MDLSIIFGITAAICWGSADFVAKIAVTKIGYLKSVLLMQSVGGVFMLLVVSSDIYRLQSFPRATYLAIILGVVNAVATIALYKSFEVGQLSIMSPISSSYSALASILAFFFLNERVTQVKLVGILCIFVGIILVSFQKASQSSSNSKGIASGVGYALTTFVCMGVLFFALKLVVIDLGGLLPVLILRIVTALVAGGFLLVKGDHAKARWLASSFSLVAFVGVVDSLAIVAYNLGIIVGAVVVVSFVSSLFSVIAILLARIVLKERLVSHQMVAVIIIISGIAIIGYFS
ncbi:MAG: EamA family transporter [Candidatus Bathyarchaeia archaeon]